ncbi:MAG: YwbE family protein [Nitrosopumilus sp. B06]|nr:MAG: YwbE family protein [Nitrosopumilus sp. B06]
MISRSEINPGAGVMIETKEDQGSGRLVSGVVSDILTSSETHPHGIKVRLEDGQVGRVKRIDVKV